MAFRWWADSGPRLFADWVMKIALYTFISHPTRDSLCPKASLITSSNQEDPSLHNWKIVDRTWRIKSNKQTKINNSCHYFLSQNIYLTSKAKKRCFNASLKRRKNKCLFGYKDIRLPFSGKVLVEIVIFHDFSCCFFSTVTVTSLIGITMNRFV